MDPSFSSQAHMGIKRDLSTSQKSEEGGNVTLPDAPLFERYGFLSPGEFVLATGSQEKDWSNMLTF